MMTIFGPETLFGTSSPASLPAVLTGNLDIGRILCYKFFFNNDLRNHGSTGI